MKKEESERCGREGWPPFCTSRTRAEKVTIIYTAYTGDYKLTSLGGVWVAASPRHVCVRASPSVYGSSGCVADGTPSFAFSEAKWDRGETARGE